jgi:hypothetical protein
VIPPSLAHTDTNAQTTRDVLKIQMFQDVDLTSSVVTVKFVFQLQLDLNADVPTDLPEMNADSEFARPMMLEISDAQIM